MSLDELYKKVKMFSYPINGKEEFEAKLGDISIEFEATKFNAKAIATAVEHYPIFSASDVIAFFIEGTDQYNYERGIELQEMLDHEFEA